MQTAQETAELLLLTVPQVAQILQIARGRAYELVADGQIPSIRLGRSVRVPRTALVGWIERATSGRELAGMTENTYRPAMRLANPVGRGHSRRKGG